MCGWAEFFLHISTTNIKVDFPQSTHYLHIAISHKKNMTHIFGHWILYGFSIWILHMDSPRRLRKNRPCHESSKADHWREVTFRDLPAGREAHRRTIPSVLPRLFWTMLVMFPTWGKHNFMRFLRAHIPIKWDQPKWSGVPVPQLWFLEVS